MNKPRFIGCTYGVCGLGSRRFDPMKCWRANHIPFVATIAADNADQIFIALLTRYARLKHILFPGEVEAFFNLFKKKHAELVRGCRFKQTHFFIGRGAYTKTAIGIYFIGPLFGHDGLFDEFPFTPPHNKRLQALAKLTSQMIRRKYVVRSL